MPNSTGEDHLRSAAQLVAERLERLSADSIWAHRASGLRGSLLRALQEFAASAPSQANPILQERLQDLIRQGYSILENAAREIVPPES